jgi:hypothetical protein
MKIPGSPQKSFKISQEKIQMNPAWVSFGRSAHRKPPKDE